PTAVREAVLAAIGAGGRGGGLEIARAIEPVVAGSKAALLLAGASVAAVTGAAVVAWGLWTYERPPPGPVKGEGIAASTDALPVVYQTDHARDDGALSIFALDRTPAGDRP